jgi:hypothetical protein
MLLAAYRPHFDGLICHFVAGFLAVAAARFAAHRFLSAATIAARPVGDSFRFGFGASAEEPPAAAFCSAHRRRWAAAIARRPAALIRRFGFAGAEPAEAKFLVPPSIRRTPAICSSI